MGVLYCRRKRFPVSGIVAELGMMTNIVIRFTERTRRSAQQQITIEGAPDNRPQRLSTVASTQFAAQMKQRVWKMISHSSEEAVCCHDTHQPAPEIISSDDRCRVHYFAPEHHPLDAIQIYVEMGFASRHEFMPALVG